MIIQTTSDQSISANEFLTKHKNDLDPTDTLNFSVIEDIDAMLKSTNLN
jgi:reverse gyrase